MKLLTAVACWLLQVLFQPAKSVNVEGIVGKRQVFPLDYATTADKHECEEFLGLKYAKPPTRMRYSTKMTFTETVTERNINNKKYSYTKICPQNNNYENSINQNLNIPLDTRFVGINMNIFYNLVIHSEFEAKIRNLFYTTTQTTFVNLFYHETGSNAQTSNSYYGGQSTEFPDFQNLGGLRFFFTTKNGPAKSTNALNYDQDYTWLANTNNQIDLRLNLMQKSSTGQITNNIFSFFNAWIKLEGTHEDVEFTHFGDYNSENNSINYEVLPITNTRVLGTIKISSYMFQVFNNDDNYSNIYQVYFTIENENWESESNSIAFTAEDFTTTEDQNGNTVSTSTGVKNTLFIGSAKDLTIGMFHLTYISTNSDGNSDGKYADVRTGISDAIV